MFGTQDQDELADAQLGQVSRIATRAVQAALLALASWRLLRVNSSEDGVNAFAGSIPWVILMLMALLLMPTLIRLGWQRFGRVSPTWVIAAVVFVTIWAISTVLCWMALTIVLILSD